MRLSDGDVVLIKTREQLDAEYGPPESNGQNYNIRYTFMPDMYDFCGKFVTVNLVNYDSFYVLEDTKSRCWSTCVVSTSGLTPKGNVLH